MTTEHGGRDTPSNDPRDHDLPLTVSVDTPPVDELPDEVDPEQIPDTETIEPYTDDPQIDFTPYLDALDHHSDNEVKVIATFLEHHERGLHPQEVAARADVPESEVADLIELFHNADIIRRSRVASGVPFYQFNSFGDVPEHISQLR